VKLLETLPEASEIFQFVGTPLKLIVTFFDAPKPVPVTVTSSPGIPRVEDRVISGTIVKISPVVQAAS
jgi:hypothetical protein